MYGCKVSKTVVGADRTSVSGSTGVQGYGGDRLFGGDIGLGGYKTYTAGKMVTYH